VTSEVRVRRAVEADAEKIAAIYNEGIRGRGATFETALRTVADRRASLTAGGMRFPTLVAELEGEVIGWSALSEHSVRACYAGIAECSVYVDARHRGRRVGQKLLRALIDEARQQGFWKLVSRVFPFNHASRGVCRSVGFREVGVYERHAQLDGEWLDVVIVERLIPENQR